MLTLVLCCGGVLGLVTVIYLPMFIVRQGFDCIIDCLGNGFIVVVTGILLLIYIDVAQVDLCETWLIGEPLCATWTAIQAQLQ